MSTKNVGAVAAIDFGTTYSGYVFSLSGDELNFYSPQYWNLGHGSAVSLKTPTALLLNPDQSLHSFGLEAEDAFADLVATDSHHKYYFFQRFKMELHSKDLHRKSNIQDISGKSVPAIEVFSLSIKYLKDHCMKTLTDRGVLSNPNDLKFVLTVPAIWNDRSKQLMRVAAIQGGIADDQLTIALEPEAASIYCQKESAEKLRFGQQNRLTDPGTRYLVADIGGGTADFSVHEVEDGGTLTELYRASGGPYGGTCVDREYLKIYDIIFGDGAIEKLKKEDMTEYLTIVREFESKKRTVKANNGSPFVTRLSAVFNEMMSNDEKMQRIQSSYLKDQVSVLKDKLKLSPSLMESFFRSSVENIVDKIQNILKSLENVHVILLVGGYAESPLVQESLRKKFSDTNIVIPQDCNLVVMKGAVLFGHNPLTISARVLRFSYGTSTEPEFDSKVHPREKRYYDRNGVERCRNFFHKLILKNEKVPSTGKSVKDSFSPLCKTQRSMHSKVFCTDKDNPVLVDESFQHLGTLEISVPDHVKGEWSALVEFVFGMTEIKVSARETATNELFETTLDMLE